MALFFALWSWHHHYLPTIFQDVGSLDHDNNISHLIEASEILDSGANETVHTADLVEQLERLRQEIADKDSIIENLEKKVEYQGILISKLKQTEQQLRKQLGLTVDKSIEDIFMELETEHREMLRTHLKELEKAFFKYKDKEKKTHVRVFDPDTSGNTPAKQLPAQAHSKVLLSADTTMMKQGVEVSSMPKTPIPTKSKPAWKMPKTQAERTKPVASVPPSVEDTGADTTEGEDENEETSDQPASGLSYSTVETMTELDDDTVEDDDEEMYTAVPVTSDQEEDNEHSNSSVDDQTENSDQTEKNVETKKNVEIVETKKKVESAKNVETVKKVLNVKTVQTKSHSVAASTSSASASSRQIKTHRAAMSSEQLSKVVVTTTSGKATSSGSKPTTAKSLLADRIVRVPLPKKTQPGVKVKLDDKLQEIIKKSRILAANYSSESGESPSKKRKLIVRVVHR